MTGEVSVSEPGAAEPGRVEAGRAEAGRAAAAASGIVRGLEPLTRRWSAIRDGLAIAGLLFAGYLFIVVAPKAGTVGFDAYSYWRLDLNHPYTLAAGALGAFPYTPVIARLLAPGSLFSWPAFWWLWSAILVATLIWLGGRKTLYVLAFPPVALELYHGNLNLLIAASIALGFRYPAAWAFALLSKVTPGVGLLWFLVRREWRHLAIALAATALIGGISLAVDSRLWVEWIQGEVLAVSSAGVGDQPNIAIPLLVRLPISALVVVWGARTDRRWTVPLAAAFALPVLWWTAFSILAAIPALRRPELAERKAAA